MLSAEVALVIVAAALGAFTWIGLRGRQDNETVEDYVVARNSQRSSTLILSFIASGLGAWVLFAVAEVGAFVGLVGVIGYALGVAAPVLAFGILGPRMRRAAPQGSTLSEFIGRRFGRPFQIYVVVVTVLYMFFFVTAELTAIGAVTSILSGLDARIAIVAVAVATLLYTAGGGLRASLRTDRWQAWLTVALIFVVAAVALGRLDAPGDAFRDSGLLSIERGGIEVAITLIIAVTAANLFHQGYWQRVWAAQDDRGLRRAGIVGGLASIPGVIIVGVLGIIATGAALDFGAPPAPFFAILGDAPAWLAALVLVLGVALVASSVDTLVNGMTSLVAAEHRRITLPQARIVTVLILVPAIVIAWQGYSVLRLFLIADLLCAATVVPALLGLWGRATTQAAFAGSIAGLAGAIVPNWVQTGALSEAVRLASFPDNAPTLLPFAGALIASTVVTLAVTMLRPAAVERDEIGSPITSNVVK